MARLKLKIKDNRLASDTETTGLSPWGHISYLGFEPARPFAFSFCDSEGNMDYIRWKVNPKTRKVIPDPKELKILKDLYANPKLINIGHNFSYDLRMLRFTGIPVKGKIHDTLILGHIMTGGSELTYGLKHLGEKYLGIDTKDEKDLRIATIKARHMGKKEGYKIAFKGVFGKDPVKADYWLAPSELCKKYALKDAERTMLFFLLWYPELLQNERLLEVYKREMTLTKVVNSMESRGVRMYHEKNQKLTREYLDYANKKVKESERYGGKGLNFRSSKQMTHKFYIEKKYPPYYNAKGNYSLDAKKLVELSALDPLAQIILDFRGAHHMLSNFMIPYDKFKVRDEKGEWVLHPSFKQCGPVTGRFSCGDPNLMCVASEDTIRNLTRVEYKPKRVLGPRKGYIWYLPDYKQIEVWVFAFLAQDKTMMESLLKGFDFHTDISKFVWGDEPDYEKHADSYRKRAKLILFCKFYGGGVKKIASLLGCDISTAQEFLEDYNTKLPGVALFMKRTMNKVSRQGYLYNPFGRIYYILPSFSYRGVNYLIQGTSADIMKSAMIKLHQLFQTKWKGCYILITLHDELILEIPLKYHSKRLMRDIIKAMQSDFHKRVNIPQPLPVSMEMSTKTWADAVKVKL